MAERTGKDQFFESIFAGRGGVLAAVVAPQTDLVIPGAGPNPTAQVSQPLTRGMVSKHLFSVLVVCKHWQQVAQKGACSKRQNKKKINERKEKDSSNWRNSKEHHLES